MGCVFADTITAVVLHVRSLLESDYVFVVDICDIRVGVRRVFRAHIHACELWVAVEWEHGVYQVPRCLLTLFVLECFFLCSAP